MLGKIANTFANCFKIPELRSRILFTLGLLAVCRLVALIHIPGLDGVKLSQYFEQQASGGVLGLFSMFTGGALEKCAVGSLGIMPYISATIIIQLLTAVVGSLQKLAREEGGRAKLIQYGRYLTVLLCLGQGAFLAIGWERAEEVFPGFKEAMAKLGTTGNLVVYQNLWWYRIQTVLILTTGALLLMWLGEQITERGIGNGVSLVITIGIVARLPMVYDGLKLMRETDKLSLANGVLLLALLILVIAGVIAVTQAQRKIPVQYAQRAVGRKVYAGGSSFMPLRVNYAGVMPIIFAQSILMFPQPILSQLSGMVKVVFIKDLCATLARYLGQEHPVHLVVMGLMILFFSYFWVATQFNELQIADDLKKNGGYIPGVRPGQATSDYLHNSMHRITLAGAIFLTVIAVIPTLLTSRLGIPYSVSTFFGGTSILIMVGVLLDTMRQMETHLLMRHYDGFLKKGRLRGRF